MKFRPEDRKGLKEGSLLSNVIVGFYKLFAKCWRRIPNFRGKVRAATELRRVLGLENHHILRRATALNLPTEYRANLDLHSWLELLAYFTGGYEPDTVKFLVRCYDKKGFFLDLGANIGLISVPFALLADTPSDDQKKIVYSVKAVKSNQRMLRDNIVINNLENRIEVISKGIAEIDKIVEIQVEGNLEEGGSTGTANILAEDTTHPCERIQLVVTTLNALIESGEIPNECSLIKIDLDGYDLKALQGASLLLEHSRPVIFGEFSAHCLGWHGQTHENVKVYMNKFDYIVHAKVDNNFKFSSAATSESDLLLIPKEKLNYYSWCCD